MLNINNQFIRPLITVMAFVAILTLSACGGGGGGNPTTVIDDGSTPAADTPAEVTIISGKA